MTQRTLRSMAAEPFGQQQLPLLQYTGDSSGPAFSENREEPFHRWVNWIAGFSADLVRDCIKDYMKREEGLVLDPFAGVGTALVEAIVAGYDAIGFEINPFAALTARTKLEALRGNPKYVDDLLSQFESWMHEAQQQGREPASAPPKGFRSRIDFFSPSILPQVLLVMDFIDELDSGLRRDLMRIAFGSTLVSYSNYTYEPSLCTRPGADRPLVEEADVKGIIAHKLSQMRKDIEQASRIPTSALGEGTLYHESFFGCVHTGRLKPSSVDLIVTSPPYLNNYHYVRNTRPHLYWLGFAESRDELRELEEESYGTFWQTVRNGPRIDLQFDLPEVSQLVDEIRSQRTEKGQYGGPGWANYAARYFNDSWRFIQLVEKLLRPGSTAVVVVGNHIIQGINVEVDRVLSEMGHKCGLHSDSHILRKKRVGDSITNSSVRRGSADVSLYETAVALRKS